MSATVVAVVLSLFSAVAYAAAAVAQERLAARSSGSGLLRLLGSGAWWLSVGLNASGALLHIVALTYGPLTVVQPLGALTLVAAVPMGARLAGRKVSAIEWRGTAFTLFGLAALLVAASGPAPDDTLSVPEALAVAGTAAVLVGALARPGGRSGLRHATASGLASGVGSALTQTVTVAATDDSGPLLSAQVIGVAVLVAAFAVGGLLLSQIAYRAGLGAPLAVVTLSNPVAAALIGLSLLGERLRGGPAGVLAAATGAALAARGVVLLSRSPRAVVPPGAARVGAGGPPSEGGTPPAPGSATHPQPRRRSRPRSRQRSRPGGRAAGAGPPGPSGDRSPRTRPRHSVGTPDPAHRPRAPHPPLTPASTP
ncbi:hypothetical protein [Streptomyces sp. F001]|uniref:hypothetical protein n=1 Tax=Streptomyces sp. F001 TaxID=1510026 RepID=UPI001F101100|nr:hypothetical protein [Streptomyces sp. F001]